MKQREWSHSGCWAVVSACSAEWGGPPTSVIVSNRTISYVQDGVLYVSYCDELRSLDKVASFVERLSGA